MVDLPSWRASIRQTRQYPHAKRYRLNVPQSCCTMFRPCRRGRLLGLAGTSYDATSRLIELAPSLRIWPGPSSHADGPRPLRLCNVVGPNNCTQPGDAD